MISNLHQAFHNSKFNLPSGWREKIANFLKETEDRFHSYELLAAIFKIAEGKQEPSIADKVDR